MSSIDAAALVEFFDVPIGGAFDVPPDKAIGYFKAKGLKPSFSYAEMLNEAHDHAFTVAKMMNVDMLAQVRASLDSALANGTSFKEWSDSIIPVLQSGGWWGRKEVLDPITGQTIVAQLGSPWRLETIFRTNMQSAYAAGQWQEIVTQADIAPWLMYDAVDDLRTRPVHASWDRKVLPVASKWWRTHYPPNGWNCRCGVIQLTDDELTALNLEPATQVPDNGTYTWTNPRTGEKTAVPVGLDPGFSHNSGQTYLQDLDQLLEQKIAALPPDMKAAVTSTKATVSSAAALKAADQAAAVLADSQAQAALQAAKAAAAAQEANAAAMTQLKAIASAKPSDMVGAAYLQGAMTKLQKAAGWQALSPVSKLEAIQAEAAAAKLKKETQSKLATYKKAVIEGKIPAPALVKALKSLPEAEQAAFLAKIDQEVAAAAAAKAAAELAAKQAALAAAQAKAAAEAAAAKLAAEAAAAKKAAAAAKKAAKAAKPPPAPAAAPVAPPIAPVTPSPGAPNPATLIKIGEQRGSNPGGTYQDRETGTKWYIKQPASAEIARNEVLGGELYKLAGVEVPEMHLVVLDGKPAIASRIIDGLEKGTPAKLAKAGGALEGFAVDAWLANWDVVGLGYDNLLILAGRAVRVDTGGSLRFRAQGGLKGATFGTSVEEIDSLRQPTNRQAASVFGGMTQAQLEASVERVLRISDADIRSAVARFGPTDAAERALLADKLIARQRDLAARYPAAAARVRAPEPPAAAPASARVTKAEQDAIEAARANGYTFNTDGDAIEDTGVLVNVLTDANGKPATRGYLKLRPQAGKALLDKIKEAAETAPEVEMRTASSAILSALKSINLRASKGEALPDPIVIKAQEAIKQAKATAAELRKALAIDPKHKTLGAHADFFDGWANNLQIALDASASNKGRAVIVPGGQFVTTQASVAYKRPAAAKSAALTWQRSATGGHRFNVARFEKGSAIETTQTGRLYGAEEVYTTTLPDGTRLTFVPATSANGRATHGALKIDVPGQGAASSSRVFGVLDELGVPSARSTELERQLLYLNSYARLRLIRNAPAGAMTRYNAITETGAEGVRKRLALIKKETGVDVEKSEGWQQSDGVRQAFGHGRAYQMRPDLDTPEFRQLERDRIELFHNPKNLGHDAGRDAFEKIKPVIDGGGIFAPLMDRYRRGVPLDGSSVEADINSGGGDYHFTRVLQRNTGAGLYWKARQLRRMDAISYEGDKFGNTTEAELLANRQGQTVDSLRELTRRRSNETIFKGGLSIFDDLDVIVLSSAGEVRDAIFWMKQRGYAKWPDGRALEEVIITKAQKEKRNA